MQVSKEDIIIARSVNLIDYLKFKGVKLKKEGKRYKHFDHSSLVFTDNLYFWNSKQESGNTLTYVNKYMNLTFVDAVKELCEFSGNEVIVKNQPKEFAINDLNLTTDIRRSFAYLTKTRKLSPNVVEFLIGKKCLAQTKESSNLAFLIYDESKNIVGAELNTTLSGKRFKGIAPNSKYGYGFNLANTNKPISGIFFESGIDLLSFIQWLGLQKFIEKLAANIFVSMAGLKINIIKQMMQIYGFEKIILAIDNPMYEKPLPDGSTPAKNFVELVKSKFDNVETFFPLNFKDWNNLIGNSKN